MQHVEAGRSQSWKMQGRIGGWELFHIRKTGRASQKKMAFEESILGRGKEGDGTI